LFTLRKITVDTVLLICCGNGSLTKAGAARGYRFWHHSGVFGGEYW